MRPFRLMVLAVAALVAVVLAVRGLATNREKNGNGRALAGESNSPSGRNADDVEALRQELNMVRSQVSMLAAQMLAVQVNAAGKIESADQGPPPDRAAVIEHDQQARMKYVNDVARSYENESVDIKWASNAHKVVEDALARNEVAMKASSIDCRSKMCRVELSGGEESASSVAALSLFVASVFSDITTDHGVGSDGKPTVVLFLSSTRG